MSKYYCKKCRKYHFSDSGIGIEHKTTTKGGKRDQSMINELGTEKIKRLQKLYDEIGIESWYDDEDGMTYYDSTEFEEAVREKGFSQFEIDKFLADRDTDDEGYYLSESDFWID